MKILTLAVMLVISTAVAAQTKAQTTTEVKKAVAVELKGDAAAGAGKVAVCMACHGEKGRMPNSPIYPRLAGQSSEYLKSSLHAYRDGLRQGGMAAMMSPQTATLSDQDIVDIAAYYSQQ
ncbi:MAG: c-type cytochrome [Pseudomonas sp.]